MDPGRMDDKASEYSPTGPVIVRSLTCAMTMRPIPRIAWSWSLAESEDMLRACKTAASPTSAAPTCTSKPGRVMSLSFYVADGPKWVWVPEKHQSSISAYKYDNMMSSTEQPKPMQSYSFH
eukprot:scaffold655912_cov57-Prasinocladus_malaysianus.AAC.1